MLCILGTIPENQETQTNTVNSNNPTIEPVEATSTLVIGFVQGISFQVVCSIQLIFADFDTHREVQARQEARFSNRVDFQSSIFTTLQRNNYRQIGHWN